jgi:ABC-2 type transport system ATP-binding protein
VGIIEQGRLLYKGPLDEIVRKARAGARVEIRVADQQDKAVRLLKGLPPVTDVAANNGLLLVSLKDDGNDITPLLRALVAANLPVLEIREESVNLETAFMRFTEGKVQ